MFGILFLLFGIAVISLIFFIKSLFQKEENKTLNLSSEEELKELNLSSGEVLKEFEKLYNLISPKFTEIEKSRKKHRVKVIVETIIVLGIISIIPILMFTYIILDLEIKNLVLYIGIFILVYMILISIKKRISSNEYGKVYNEEVINTFIKYIDQRLIYNDKIDRNKKDEFCDSFKSIDFDNYDFDSFSARMYIEGFLNDVTFIKMAKVCAIRNLVTGRTLTLFNGVFAYNKCNKYFENSILITKSKTNSYFLTNKIELGNEEFEKCFNVYSKDKEVAINLLNSEFMSLLLSLFKKYNLEFEIGFKDSNIYFRFYTKDYIKIKVFKNSTDFNTLYEMYYALKAVVEIIKEINLYLNRI